MAKTARAKVSVDDLVRSALLKAAEADAVKLTDKVDGLFASASGANGQAIAACKSAEKPLLRIVGKEGKAELVALAPAGFERIAADVPEEKVGAVAKRVALAVPAAERVAFIQDTISRTPLAAPELTPLLEEAITAEKAENEARVAAAAKRRAAEEAAKKALERAVQLFEERKRNRLDALRREWEAEGETPPERPEREAQSRAGAGTSAFRREIAERLVSAWLYNARHNKTEVATALDRVLRGIDGIGPFGTVGEEVRFDGRVHECARGVSDGEPVRVIRPGWEIEGEVGAPLLRALVG